MSPWPGPNTIYFNMAIFIWIIVNDNFIFSDANQQKLLIYFIIIFLTFNTFLLYNPLFISAFKQKKIHVSFKGSPLSYRKAVHS